MRVHLIKKQTIEDFILENAPGKAPFEAWLSILKKADWNAPINIIATYIHADIIGNGSERVVFDIGGNKYRLICKYHFGQTEVHLFIKWIGTHAEYSQLCSDGKQYVVDLY
jgi:mRNA interferase HigB